MKKWEHTEGGVTDTCHNANPQEFGEAYTPHMPPLFQNGSLAYGSAQKKSPRRKKNDWVRGDYSYRYYSYILKPNYFYFRRKYFGGTIWEEASGWLWGPKGAPQHPLAWPCLGSPNGRTKASRHKGLRGTAANTDGRCVLHILMIQKPTPRMPGIGRAPKEEGKSETDSLGRARLGERPREEGEDRFSDLHINPVHWRTGAKYRSFEYAET